MEKTSQKEEKRMKTPSKKNEHDLKKIKNEDELKTNMKLTSTKKIFSQFLLN